MSRWEASTGKATHGCTAIRSISPSAGAAPRRTTSSIKFYQITIDDPMILTKPWTSATREWSLAAPNDECIEVLCTHNEEPEEWKHIDKDVKDDYEDRYKK